MDKYNKWLNSKFIKKEDKEILKNMSENEIKESFSEDLKFGTAGIRGIMGLGTNRMNEYTIGKVTVGLSKYLNENYDNPSVVIAYDTRNNSKDFALKTCLILNYYGIKTYLFNEVTSTPELSFAVKYLKCSSGIVITSSHNAKIYNGYKVYNNKGGQIVPPEDELIINKVNGIETLEMIKYAPLNNELFNVAGSDVHEAFIKENENAIINKDLFNNYISKLKITYSSLHGVGLKLAKYYFDKYNVNYNIASEQSTYDGNFPYAPEPNPEYIFNYDLAIKYAKENDSDLIILTDPDADRIGIMYKSNNEYKLLNGNIIGVLFLDYIINNTKLNNDKYVVKSIVTSKMVNKICDKNNIKCIEVLTGCKNIANKREELGYDNYLFGFEESLGYMFNINISDKNGFSSMLSIMEIMCLIKDKNISFDDYLDNIYKKYGYYLDETLNFVYEGIEGKEKINDLMNDFRCDNIKFDNSIKEDYMNKNDETKTNAVKYTFNDDSSIIIRPSGTEPKIKVYINVVRENIKETKDKLEVLKTKIKKIFS